jgi:putative DNA primase/helicase
MYQDGRFFIMTGNMASEYCDIADCTETIKPLHEKYIGGGSEPTTIINKPVTLSLSQSEVIRLAGTSKQGAMFNDLYSGNWQQYFTSQSDADMSFCNMLAFWCGRDEILMDSIFRSSGLMRDKWNRKQSNSTYGAITISKAARDCRSVYEGKEEYQIFIGGTPTPENKNDSKKQEKLYTFDDTGNSERIIDTFGENIRYDNINKEWIYYDGRKWCIDCTGAIKRMCDEVVEKMRYELDVYLRGAEDEDEMEKVFNKHIKASRSNKAKVAMIKQSEHQVPVLPQYMDNYGDYINTPNGIINLKSGELLPHDNGKMLSKITNTEYTDKIDYPMWSNFLETTFKGDKDLIRYIQKAIGYSLTGSTEEQCAFFCYGDGRNGKSTFLDTISDILGDYAINIQPETIMVKKQNGGANSDIARLKGARFVVSVEPEEGMRLNEGLVKQLTGGDKVTARKLYGNEFEFSPEFKLWMGTNHKPIIRGTDTGIWRRIRLIPFTTKIDEDKVDKHLKQKLKQEYPAILNWAVDGCLLWRREGLNMPEVVEESVKEYRNEMDVISNFLSECTLTGGNEKAGDLYQGYKTWATENSEYLMSSTKFGIEISKRFEKVKCNNATFYRDIALAKNYKKYNISIG